MNGELRQDSNTELMINGIEKVICELTQGMTLQAGTIIAMGTPAGVGMGFEPPRFLKRGDVVTCENRGHRHHDEQNQVKTLKTMRVSPSNSHKGNHSP